MNLFDILELWAYDSLLMDYNSGTPRHNDTFTHLPSNVRYGNIALQSTGCTLQNCD